MNTHVHVLIGEHFIEITLACVTEKGRGGVGVRERAKGNLQGVSRDGLTKVNLQGFFPRGLLVEGFWCWF